MRPRLSILLGACCLIPLSCREEPKKTKTPPPEKTEAPKEKADPKKKPLINIPAGAVISDLTLPYFNEEKQRVSLLTIKELTLNTDGEINKETLLNGETLKLWLFEKNGAIRTITTIPSAIYRIEDEVIETEGNLVMRSADDQFAAQSNGGIFTLQTGQALLLGPATTRFNIPKKKKDPTAMNIRPLLPVAGIATMLVAAPPEVSPEQLADFERQVAPRIIPTFDGTENFQRADQLEAPANRRLAAFLDSVDQTALISQTDPTPPADDDPLKDLFKPGPESIVITCSKGLYLDGENREIVYLGDIKIEGRGLTMTCTRDLKAIFDPPPVEPKKADKADKTEEKKKDDPLSRFGGFGDLKQFTASGTVRISGTNEDGKKIYFGGDRALYEMTKSGDQINSTVTLRGDQLAFMIGDPKNPKNAGGTVALRSISPDAWIVATIKDEIINVRTSDDGWQTVALTPKKEGQ